MVGVAWMAIASPGLAPAQSLWRLWPAKTSKSWPMANGATASGCIPRSKWLDSAGERLHLLDERCPYPWDSIVASLLDLPLLARCAARVFPGWSSPSTVSDGVGGFKPEQVMPLESRLSPPRRIRAKLRKVFKRPF